jgi:hypothetical protein
MNERGQRQSCIHSLRLLIFREKEGVSPKAFDIIIVIDGDIHKVATVEAKGGTLLGFGEDIGPHHFCGTVADLKIAIVNLVFDD